MSPPPTRLEEAIEQGFVYIDPELDPVGVAERDLRAGWRRALAVWAEIRGERTLKAVP